MIARSAYLLCVKACVHGDEGSDDNESNRVHRLGFVIFHHSKMRLQLSNTCFLCASGAHHKNNGVLFVDRKTWEALVFVNQLFHTARAVFFVARRFNISTNADDCWESHN